jgi:omega-6 fatty acid desaturase (delta-12 desaturase)
VPASPPTTLCWRTHLAVFSTPRLDRSLLDLATSIVPYLVLMVGSYFALSVSYLLVLAMAIPAAGFLIRTFIVFHDCTHGSFFRSRRANRWVGAVVGLALFMPFLRWQHTHAMHHASAGDLERRGSGDVLTLTVAEYRARGPRGRLAYRLFRHPLVMFGLGPFAIMIVGPRLPAKGARPRMRRSVMRTNLALLVLIAGLCWLVGPIDYLLVQAPAAMLAMASGIWLFYVQHQFEDAYWEQDSDWSWVDAALRGSSYLRLSPVLQFFTGNIGLHHVHHLCAKIPNYNLQAAHESHPALADVPTLSLREALRTTRLKLWDEDTRRMVRFPPREGRPSGRVLAGRSARIGP